MSAKVTSLEISEVLLYNQFLNSISFGIHSSSLDGLLESLYKLNNLDSSFNYFSRVIKSFGSLPKVSSTALLNLLRFALKLCNAVYILIPIGNNSNGKV